MLPARAKQLLSGKWLTDEGALAFAQAADQFEDLEQVDFSQTGVSDDVTDVFEDAGVAVIADRYDDIDE